MKKLFFLLATIGVASFGAAAQKKPLRKLPPAKKVSSTVAVTGSDTETGTRFSMTIEQGDRKTEISSGQFEERDGNTIAAGDNKLLLFYGAYNKTNDRRFSFNAAIPKSAKGVYTIAGVDQSPFFSVTGSAFPDEGALKSKSGAIEITLFDSGAGFVEGTFSGACVSTSDDGTFGNFKVSGSFRLRKRLE